MAGTMDLYGDGVIDEDCPTCLARPGNRCRKLNGNPTMRAIPPHKARIEKARKRKNEQR